MEELERLRKKIDTADEKILKAMAERRKVLSRILKAKKDGKRSMRDLVREEKLLGRLIRVGRKNGLDAHLITRVFHEIIDDSVRSQQREAVGAPRADARVAFQGIAGAYSELAAKKYFGQNVESFEGFKTFEEVARSVESGSCGYGILPVENTTAGSINQVYDLLSRASLAVIGEEILEVRHCLHALEDVPVHNIRRILSHPQALAQCMKFIGKLNDCEVEYYHDTAMAVRKVKDRQDLSQAAIASEEAGRKYGLKVIARDLADRRENLTRFIIVAREPRAVDLGIASKTSLIFGVSHEEGALLKALTVFHEHKINISKLESRPRPNSPFQYLFYADFEGNIAEDNVAQALEEVKSATSYFKLLGSYPARDRQRARPKAKDIARSKRKAKKSASGPKVSYRLASRNSRKNGTEIRVGDVTIGGSEFVVFAGPCAVESREQVMACAKQVKEAGGHILRGGCFKPRTSPYSFQGLGFEGLDLLAEAGQRYDLPIVTEVLAPEDVAGVAEKADILQIGARNMQNFSLLRAVGQVDRPVMLKRGMSAKIEEFLNAAEYILGQGNQQVFLCERGIRTFETSTRNTLDLGAIPILKRLTHLPVIVDPSHAAGSRDLVIPLALASHAVGPHGMMVEIHPEPAKALSDGPQALFFDDFSELMKTIDA